jgi:hypothetical protein
MNILVLKKKNVTDFAKERNEMLEKSNSVWNLFLDSDEKIEGIIPSETRSQAWKSINRLLRHDNNHTSAYIFRRKNYFLRQYVGDDYLIRLIRKGTGRWVRKVHEYWKVEKGHIGSVPDIIIHNTAPNLKNYINKMNYYSTLHARANYEEDKKSSLFKIIIMPIVKFIVTFFKSKNVVFSIMQSFHSYLSWTKLYLRQY